MIPHMYPFVEVGHAGTRLRRTYNAGFKDALDLGGCPSRKILHCLKHENHKLYINGKVIKCADRKPTEVR